jgi:hypothetical protein
MKVDTCIALAAFILSACSDDGPDIIRSSKNVPLEKIEFSLDADVHTHLGKQGEPDVTHTTVSVELFTKDVDGYYYNLEVDKTDLLNVEVNGKVTPLRASDYPSKELKMAVIYYEDFEETAANTEFKVALSRNSGADVKSVSVTLLDDTVFSVSPPDDILFSQLLSLEWEAKEAYKYRLLFELICEGSDGKVSLSSVGFPNRNVISISSPFTFNPVNFFNQPDPAKMIGCKLHSSLFSIAQQASFGDTPLNSNSVQSTRQHHTEKVITLN